MKLKRLLVTILTLIIIIGSLPVATFANEAERIIVTDICDQFDYESVYGGILSICLVQDLCRDILKHILPYQMGEQYPDDLLIATKEEMEELWHKEVEAMRAELRMLKLNRSISLFYQC